MEEGLARGEVRRVHASAEARLTMIRMNEP